MNSSTTSSPRSVFFIAVSLSLALFLSGFFVVLTPLPMLYVGIHYGRALLFKVSLFCLVLLVQMYLFLLAPLNTFYSQYPNWAWLLPVPGMNFLEMVSARAVSFYGLMYFLLCMGIAVSLEKTLRIREKAFDFILNTVALMTLCLVSAYLIYTFFIHQSPTAFLKIYYTRAFEDFLVIQKGAGISIDQMALISQNKDAFVFYLTLLNPSFLFCFIYFMAFLNLFIGKRVFGTDQSHAIFPLFSHFRLPFHIVWGVILSISLVLLYATYIKENFFLIIGANGLMIVGFLYFIQGLAILSHFLDKYGVRPFGRFLTFLMVFLLFQILGLLLIGLGFFDSWVDIRKMGEKDKKRES